MKTKIAMLVAGFLTIALWTVAGYAGTATEYMKDKRTMQKAEANPATSQDLARQAHHQLAPERDKGYEQIEGLGSGRIHEKVTVDVEALAPGHASSGDVVTGLVGSLISGFLGKGEDSTGNSLTDTLSQRRQEKRDQFMSTDPRSHMPREAQDGLSPRADRTGQAMDGEKDDSDWDNPYDSDDSDDSGTKDDTDWTDEPNPYDSEDKDEISEVEHQIINDWVTGDDKEDSDDDWKNPYDEEEENDDWKNPYGGDDTTPLPDDPGPLPPGVEGIIPPGLEDVVTVKPGDMGPWINPNPEETAAHVDLSMIQMDPITPLINPDLEQQGGGGAGDEKVVPGPGYGHTDPSPDDSKGGSGK